jgi:hypothetical protein
MKVSDVVSRIDRRADQWNPESLHRAFLMHGCAVVRGAVPKIVLDQIGAAVDLAYAKTDDIHVYDKDIDAITNGRYSGFELAGSNLLQDFLDRVYEGQSWSRAHVTARRISGADLNRDWQRPLDLHLDSQFHDLRFTTNFWVPFHDCGIDAPSLQVVPIDYQTTRAYSGFTGHRLRDGEPHHFGLFNLEKLKTEAVEREFGHDCYFRPVMRPGDVIISSNWVIHGSYRTPNMKRGRTSAEVRFIGSMNDIYPAKPPGFLSRLGAMLGVSGAIA